MCIYVYIYHTELIASSMWSKCQPRSWSWFLDIDNIVSHHCFYLLCKPRALSVIVQILVVLNIPQNCLSSSAYWLSCVCLAPCHDPDVTLCTLKGILVCSWLHSRVRKGEEGFMVAMQEFQLNTGHSPSIEKLWHLQHYEFFLKLFILK